MAKLSAHGRKELWRMELFVNEERIGYRQRVTVAQMDDGCLLRKVDGYNGAQWFICSGWRVFAQLKKGTDLMNSSFRETHRSLGFQDVPVKR